MWSVELIFIVQYLAYAVTSHNSTLNTPLSTLTAVFYVKFSPQGLWNVDRKTVEKAERKILSTKAVENL